MPQLPPLTKNILLEVKGTPVPFAIACEGSAPAVFCLGVRKSGSTLLNRMVTFLALCNGVNPVDIPGTMFGKGAVARDWSGLDLAPLIRPQNLYSGFRLLPPGLAGVAAFRAGRKVFMFRDPRDSLVSQYFSDAYSHPLPAETGTIGTGHAQFLEKRARAQATPIDDYVLLHARPLAGTLAEYVPLLDDPNCLTLRYEEHLFLKRRLVAKVLRHFGWTASQEQVDQLMADVDQIPEAEDRNRFLRKAIPGDHRAKLRPETIDRLDEILGPMLRRYDYL